MKYHLYYHDDFDGMASGAVMLNFLRSRGDGIVSYNPIDYIPDLNENWVRYKFKKPFILVDFRYHPAADWWFDHHKSSFTRPALSVWGKAYKNGKTRFHNSSFASCASLILAHLSRHFEYRPPKHIKELAKWDDIIDAGRYKSVTDVIESRSFALKIRIYTYYEKNKKHRVGLLKELSEKTMRKIASGARVAQKVKLGLAENARVIKWLKKISLVSKKTAFVDGVKNNLETNHFMVYYVFPHVRYSIILEKMPGGYHLRLGFNRWQKEKRRVDISKIAEKYGGGGHVGVGAIEHRSKKEIMKIAQEVIEYLNKHG